VVISQGRCLKSEDSEEFLSSNLAIPELATGELLYETSKDMRAFRRLLQ
jgi:hypothetical protein